MSAPEKTPIENLDDFDASHQRVLSSVNVRRILLPVALGVVALALMFWFQFDPTEFKKINWTWRTFRWVCLAGVLLLIRHLSYAARIYTLAQGELSFWKCIQLIAIWEFSSAVTPTSLGGSAVALFFLSQEKLSFARTTSIVLYTVILDTFFFLILIPLILLITGAHGIRPHVTQLNELGSWGWIFFTTMGIMLAYGSLFFYGLFINPKRTGQLLNWFASLPLLRRFSKRASELGSEFEIASQELRQRDRLFHVRAALFTILSWICKFALMICIVNGIAPQLTKSLYDQLIMFFRMASMFVMVLVVPTPGGAGFAEFAFGDFLSDYMSKGIAVIAAAIWRLMAYYSYLFLGALIIPGWLATLIMKRRQEKSKTATVSTNKPV